MALMSLFLGVCDGVPAFCITSKGTACNPWGGSETGQRRSLALPKENDFFRKISDRSEWICEGIHPLTSQS